MPDADPAAVFRALCESRALRWRTGAIAAEHGGDGWIGHAVDPLQRWAVDNGLVDRIGQDAVQAIMSDAFAEVRHG
jgi:hypothetical protein